MVNDNSLNAFVMTGQTIFMHSGTILQADNAGQIQGIIAHELGHIAGGHSVRFGPEGMSGATSISLLSMLAAVGAIAAGAGEAGMALMGIGQTAAMGKVLSFNRQQESRTDQAGARFLEAAGISGRGSIEFFQKLLNQEFRYSIPQENAYARTHPLNGDRIAALQSLYEASPYWDTPTDPDLEARFQRIRGKLYGYVETPTRTMQKYPPSDTSEAARVARAYAWHKGAYPDEAARETDAMLAENPDDPYVLELKGQVLLESGRPAEAIEPLRAAVALAGDQPLIATLLGHALLATEDDERIGEAIDVLRTAVRYDRENPFAWYQLGNAYTRQGDEARAALATAEQAALTRQPQLAFASARNAMAGIDRGTPDWIRAQDILLVAEHQMESEKN